MFDGASYFKAEVTASIEAWAALTKVSAPHHSESHGIIERHNETYLNILKCFGNVENWREYYASAFEASNRCHCEAISRTEAKFSPIEICGSAGLKSHITRALFFRDKVTQNTLHYPKHRQL